MFYHYEHYMSISHMALIVAIVHTDQEKIHCIVLLDAIHKI